MKSIREKSGGFGSNRLSQEQIGTEFSTRICDLESHVNRDEKETVRAKEGIAEEIKREDYESDTTRIPRKVKRKQRDPLTGGVNCGSTSRDDRSNSPIVVMKPKIA